MIEVRITTVVLGFEPLRECPDCGFDSFGVGVVAFEHNGAPSGVERIELCSRCEAS
ncbi:MAG TPA: hypothetical protein VLE97_07920 [Gaiellaceae bacterium]|nr:hypothetical protein [Gaiellaceae bacterium]